MHKSAPTFTGPGWGDIHLYSFGSSGLTPASHNEQVFTREGTGGFMGGVSGTEGANSKYRVSPGLGIAVSLVMSGTSISTFSSELTTPSEPTTPSGLTMPVSGIMVQEISIPS